jgi:hypothetical protein
VADDHSLCLVLELQLHPQGALEDLVEGGGGVALLQHIVALLVLALLGACKGV